MLSLTFAHTNTDVFHLCKKVDFVETMDHIPVSESCPCHGVGPVPRQPPSPWPWQNLSGCGYTPVHVAPSMHPTVPKSGFQLIALVAVGTRHKISPSHKLRSVLNTALIFRQHSKCTRLIRDAGRSFSLCVAYLRFPGTNFTRQRAIFVQRQSVFLPCP